jgi:beta-galactosidase
VGAEPPCPHEIRIDMQSSVELAGFRYLPRQDNQNGWIADYEFYASEDGKDWGAPVANGAFPSTSEEKVVRFEKPCRARFIRFVALSSFGDKPWASIAELDVIAH